jgi:hypothetical protein
MYVYDTWKFEEPNDLYPRLLISNAVWRKDPALYEAAKRRIEILAAAIKEYNDSTTTPIQSLTIECGVLGMWREYPEDTQQVVLANLPSLIQTLL